jgi:hypothetical protein
MTNIVVARFNEEMLEDNKRFRLKHNLGCLYGSPFTMNKLGAKDLLFVVEMNTQRNQVEGIGLVLNIVKTGPQYQIYSDYNLNRFVYCGKYRLDRSELETLTCQPIAREETETEPELASPSVNVLEMLDKILFKGKSHMKRGKQISPLTDKHIYRGGTTCKKLQHAIIQQFVNTFQIRITLFDQSTYKHYVPR